MRRTSTPDARFLKDITGSTHNFANAGLRVSATPPGELTGSFVFSSHVLDINIASAQTTLAINSDHLMRGETPANSVAWVPKGSDGRIATKNRDWCLGIEVGSERLAHLTVDDPMGTGGLGDYRPFQSAPQTAHLSCLLLSHLRFGLLDRLFVEGMSLAILAGGLGVARTGRETNGPATAGTNPRIARALDYVEAHLGGDLSVAELAAVAAMSPSWFQSAFKATIGQPVFAYVRERRLERARALLADRRLSLSQIAYGCGFSSHSHMTQLFRAHYGSSPKNMR
ncbi:AraC family transcriptional regulator [Cognatiyoonia sp. IB215182]|uniref:AraC family transcriptional regulator n=1 Tax=Cognatiyoonia sp. IB215182 TaxID=3097353 RepID=UPI002A11A6BA|nr:AraC family transcriptional regulator [Cognatiyoonia sp. IB215182]MDX8350873.1 AraC family transcriptional regulator [Cognatiyoonia sp. IB215182]